VGDSLGIGGRSDARREATPLAQRKQLIEDFERGPFKLSELCRQRGFLGGRSQSLPSEAEVPLPEREAGKG
jgi:hypothetical protein